MFFSKATGNHYCAVCNDKFHRGSKFPSKLNDAEYKCPDFYTPEGGCNSNLSFREFFARTCCTVAMKNSKNCGLSTEDQKQRVEFQDLKKMMNLLEVSKRRNNDAKKDAEMKLENYNDAFAVYVEKREKREESEKTLTATFKDADSYMIHTDGDFIHLIWK